MEQEGLSFSWNSGFALCLMLLGTFFRTSLVIWVRQEGRGSRDCFDKFQHSTSKPPYPNTTLATETKVGFNCLLPCPLEPRGTSWSCRLLDIVRLSFFFFLNEWYFLDRKKSPCQHVSYKAPAVYHLLHTLFIAHVPLFYPFRVLCFDKLKRVCYQ